MAKQSILDLRAELEVLYDDLRRLGKRNPTVVSLKANIVRMEALLNLKEANVLSLEAAVRDAAKAKPEVQEHPPRKLARCSLASSSGDQSIYVHRVAFQVYPTVRPTELTETFCRTACPCDAKLRS